MEKDCRDLLQAELKNIFRNFYDRILSDEHLSIYFDNKQQVEDLIGKQHNNFCRVLKYGAENFKNEFYDLGKKHHDMNIPLSAVEHSFLFLQREMFSTENFPFYCSPVEIMDMLSTLVQNFAEGYLDRDLLVFHPCLDLVNNYAEDTLLLKEHIKWFSSLLYAIEKKDENALDEDEVKKQFTQGIISEKYKNIFAHKEDSTYLHRINSDIHKLKSVLFYYINKEDYLQAYNIFTNIKESFLLFNQVLGSLERIETIQNLSHDELTGLLARHDLDYIFANQITAADRMKTELAVIMADIDHFKRVNDNYGHTTGDCVLKKFAEIIGENIRKTDYAFRYGGEEFLLLLYGVDYNKAFSIAERIRKSLSDTNIACEGSTLNITSSFGLTMYKPDESKAGSNLIDTADKYLYRAKELGRNRVMGD